MLCAVIFAIAALLFSSSCGWQRSDNIGIAGIRIVEFSNSSSVSVDCDWTVDDVTSRRRAPLQQPTANNRPIHQQLANGGGLVADNGDSATTDGLSLTWLDANRQPVVSIPGIRHVLSNGTLQFPAYRDDAYRSDVHSAEYRCLASTATGALLSPPVIIRSVVIGALQVYASDAYTLPGNTAVLPCLVMVPVEQAWAVQVTHWTVSSGPNNQHLVDSHAIPQPGAKYALIGGHLHVADVSLEDTQLSYRCFARHRLNGQQRQTYSSPPAKIIFTHHPSSTHQQSPLAPQLVPFVPALQHPSTSLRIKHVRLAHDDIYMTCTVSAYPPAKIRWFKVNPANGAAVALVTDGRRISTGGDWFRIGQPNGDDAGRYRCQATNSQGQMEVEFRLDVHGPLRARLEPQRQVVGVNQPAELTCNVSGLLSPQLMTPSIRWTRNGIDIPVDAGRFYMPQLNVLRINRAAVTDSGMYQCFVRVDTTGQFQQQSVVSQALSGSYQHVQASAELIVRDSAPSRLTDVFNEQMVYPGRPAFLHCSVSSHGSPSPPSIAWTVDSLTIPYTSGRVSTSSHLLDNSAIIRSYLNISSSEVEDGGLYCCSVLHPAMGAGQLDYLDTFQLNGQEQHCARLNVYGIPVIRWAGNKTAVAGQDYNLDCPFAGYPVQSVTWLRAGQLIKETDNKYKMFANGTLRISAMEPAVDGGEYTCAVKGSGSSIAKKALYVEVIRPPVIEPFGFPMQVQDGGRTQVTCSISSGDLPIKVSWTRDGRPIAANLNVEMQTGEFHSLLIFKKLRGEHSGVYTCTARNLAKAASHSAVLLVQVPPKWIVEPQDAALLENYPASIPCQVHGMPPPSVRWFRMDGENNIAVHSSSKVSLLPDGSLRFSRMSKSDEGLFQCRAGNNIASALSKTVRISVNAAAKVRIHTSGAIFPTGSEALLRCEGSGDPPMTIHWKRFDQLIEPQQQMERFQLSSSTLDGREFLDLNISRIEADDGGVYVCQAANLYGSDASDIRLIVQELPKAPGQLQLTSIQSRSAELQWLDDEEVDPLLEYRVQLTRPGTTGWTFNQTIEARGRSLVTLPHLHAFTVYEVQVSAINSAGIGPPSAPVQFQTHEEVPAGPVRHVQAEAKSSRSALVSWLPPNEETWNGRLVTFTVTCVETSGNGQIIQRSVAHLSPDSKPVRRIQVTIENLVPATVYAVTVRALNRMGAGPESEPPVALTTPEAPPTSPPINLHCVTLSADAIQLTWTHPIAAHHNGHLQGFRIFYKVLSSNSVVSNHHRLALADELSSFVRPESKRVGPSLLDSVLYGLQAYHNYSIQISAINRAGNGPPSVPVVCQTDESVPGAVQEVKASSVSSSSIVVTWRRPTPPGGRIMYYVIQLKDTVTQETKRFMQHETDNVLEHQVNQLVENRLYEVSITVKGRAGEGRPSRTLTVTPMAKSGAKILEFSRTIWIDEQQRAENVILSCPATGTNPVEKSWTFAGQPLSSNPHLNYRWDKDGALQLLGVDRHVEGDYACTARNQHGRDAVVFTVHLLRPPEIPQLSVTPTSTSSIRLWWNKPSSSGSKLSTLLAVLEYVVSYRPALVGSAVQEKSVDGNEDGTILDGLLCGTQYELQVQARNQIGLGQKSPLLRAMTRGSGPASWPESSSLFGFSAAMPATLFIHLDHWPTGGCRISSFQVEKRGPVQSGQMDHSSGNWNTLASNLNPDEQPMLKVSDFVDDETYQLRLTATSDSGIHTVSYNVRRISGRKVEHNGSAFDVVPMTTPVGQSISYESLIVIASMSISGIMLLFSLAAITYVIHKRKEYQANAASAVAAAGLSAKSEYSLRTVAEQLDNQAMDDNPNQLFQQHGRSLPRSNGMNGSSYSLRKQIDFDEDDDDDGDITPYATFTLKPINGMDTCRSLMSAPSAASSGLPDDSHSPNSIEADVNGVLYGHHPTLPCMSLMQQPPPHPAHVYRHLNRSPVPPYRPSCEPSTLSTADSLYGESTYTSTITSKKNSSIQHIHHPPVLSGRNSVGRAVRKQQRMSSNHSTHVARRPDGSWSYNP